MIGCDLSAYPNVKRWLGRMKALKSWKPVNEVIDGYGASLKGQPMRRRLSPRAGRSHRHDPQAAPQRLPLPRLRADAAFYEDFLGLPLAGTLEIKETKSGRATDTLHTFYRLDDGSYLAFFEAPDMPFDFKAQHDYDLHIALEVERDGAGRRCWPRARPQGIETRGVSTTASSTRSTSATPTAT